MSGAIRTYSADPAVSWSATPEQIEKAYELAGICDAGFKDAAQWKNWGTKHAEEIKALPEWLRARIKVAYQSAPFKTTQGTPPIEAAGGVK